jgi:hypothetical protein
MDMAEPPVKLLFQRSFDRKIANITVALYWKATKIATGGSEKVTRFPPKNPAVSPEHAGKET